MLRHVYWHVECANPSLLCRHRRSARRKIKMLRGNARGLTITSFKIINSLWLIQRTLLTSKWICKQLPLKSRWDSEEMTDSLRRLRAWFMSATDVIFGNVGIRFGPMLWVLVMRGNVGRLGMARVLGTVKPPLLCSEIFRSRCSFLLFLNSKAWISGNESSSPSSSWIMPSAGYSFSSNSTSISSSFKCHLTGWRRMDPIVAWRASAAKMRTAPRNENCSSRYRTSWKIRYEARNFCDKSHWITTTWV